MDRLELTPHDATANRGESTPSIAPERRFPIIVVAGPTASGKSELALELAATFNGEIVNFDSVQIYRGFDIGSAKTPVSDRRGIPHHLIDYADPNELITAGAYARFARKILQEIAAKEHVPVLVGGTGFYLRALLDGLSPAPIRNEVLRERLTRVEDRRPGVLYRFLRRFDNLTAARIHENDTQKLLRAVEMTIEGKQPASDIQSGPKTSLEGFRVLKLGLMPDRTLLKERINHRSRAMFQSGLIEETEMLLRNGLSADAKPMKSVGYKQAIAYLERRLSLDYAITECQTKTRQYAKRQLTWFRADSEIQWLHGFGNEFEIQNAARRLAAEFLNA